MTAAVVIVVAVAALGISRLGGSDSDDPGTGAVVRVGPSSGEAVQTYVDRAGSALATAGSGDQLGLVSLAAYQTPAQLVKTLNTFKVERVYARVPADNIQTKLDSYPVITAAVDIPAGMRRLAQTREQDAIQQRADAAKITDPAQRKLATENAKVAQGEAAAYRDSCACLYGAVISAPTDRLAELSQASGIRVIEPAPAGTELANAVFTPLLPEQTETVQPPADSAFPGATPTPAPSTNPRTPSPSAPR